MCSIAGIVGLAGALIALAMALFGLACGVLALRSARRTKRTVDAALAEREP